MAHCTAASLGKVVLSNFFVVFYFKQGGTAAPSISLLWGLQEMEI